MNDQEFEKLLASITDQVADDIHVIVICLDPKQQGAYVGTSLEPDDAQQVLQQLRMGLGTNIVTVKADK